MTGKKEQILKTALELFGTLGYTATSTSKIAKAAGVSEGLIFRHFKNKQGLLESIAEDAKLRIGQLMGPLLMETDAKKVIELAIKLPFTLTENNENKDFWKLQFKLKWEIENFSENKMQPLIDKIQWAFAELNYEHPEMESLQLLYITEAIAGAILKGTIENENEFERYLINKYKV